MLNDNPWVVVQLKSSLPSGYEKFSQSISLPTFPRFTSSWTTLHLVSETPPCHMLSACSPLGYLFLSLPSLPLHPFPTFFPSAYSFPLLPLLSLSSISISITFYTHTVYLYTVSHSLLPLDFHFHSHLLAYTSMPFLLLHNPLTQWTTEKAFSPFY